MLAVVLCFGVGLVLAFRIQKDSGSPSAVTDGTDGGDARGAGVEVDWETRLASVGRLRVRELLEATTPGRLHPTEVLTLELSERAATDPAGAFARALELDDRDDLTEAAEAVLRVVAEKNPRAAMQLLDADPPQLKSEHWLQAWLGRTVLEIWSQRNLDDARNYLLGSEFWRNLIATDLAASDSGNFQELLSGFRESWPGTRHAEWIAMVAELESGTPVECRATLDDDPYVVPNFSYSKDRISSLAPILALADPVSRDNALIHALRFCDEAVGRVALDHVSPERRDAAVATLANGIQHVAGTIPALEFMAAELSPQNTVSLQQNGAEIFPILPSSVEWFDSLDRETFANWPPWFQSKVLEFVDYGRPYTPVIEMALAISEPAQRAPVIENRMTAWGHNEPDEASRWLAGIDPGADRDVAVAGLVQGIVRDDPGGAAQWAETISDPELRERYTRLALGFWLENDAPLAREAVMAADLSEAAKVSLLQRNPEAEEETP